MQCQHPYVTALVLLRLQANYRFSPVDVAPLKAGNFTLAPAGKEAEQNNVPQVLKRRQGNNASISARVKNSLRTARSGRFLITGILGTRSCSYPSRKAKRTRVDLPVDRRRLAPGPLPGGHVVADDQAGALLHRVSAEVLAHPARRHNRFASLVRLLSRWLCSTRSNRSCIVTALAFFCFGATDGDTPNATSPRRCRSNLTASLRSLDPEDSRRSCPFS